MILPVLFAEDRFPHLSVLGNPEEVQPRCSNLLGVCNLTHIGVCGMLVLISVQLLQQGWIL